MPEQKHPRGIQKLLKPLRELGPHATWRGIEVVWDLVRSALLTALVAGSLWFTHHVDIIAIVIVFVACLLLLVWKDWSTKVSGLTHRSWDVPLPSPDPSQRDKTGAASLDLASASVVRILRRNESMLSELSHLIDERKDEFKKVIVIQYSGVNATQAVREIYSRTNAEIEVYLVDPSCGINDHQIRRITDWRQYAFANELKKIKSGGTWHQFTYDAPGSLRAILIEGVVLFVGPYFYEVSELDGKSVLDVRGGERPLFEVPSTHPDFSHLEGLIKDMVNDWKYKTIVKNWKKEIVKNWREVKDSQDHVIATPFQSSPRGPHD